MLLLAVSSMACGRPPSESDGTSEEALFRKPIGPIGLPPIIVLPPNPPDPPPPSLYVGDANDLASILSESDIWYQTYFSPGWPKVDEAASVAAEAAAVRAGFPTSSTPDPVTKKLPMPPYWAVGRRTSALAQMYDLMAPLDPVRAGVYLERLRAIGGALLDERDDNRTLDLAVNSNVVLSPTGQPYDAFRQRVMPAWGAFTENRDGRWNTDVVTSALFVYAMAAFARRVTDNAALQGRVGGDGRTYAAEAIRFTTASIETYEGFRPELHLDESDAEAYFTQPQSYAYLSCPGDDDNDSTGCHGYRDTAGQPVAYNENLSMMKALSEVALASDSALYRASGAANPRQLARATAEAPLVIAKAVRFFDDNLQTLAVDGGSDGTVLAYQWNHQKPTARIQDTAHASFELGSFAVVWENKASLDALLARNGRPQQIPISLFGLSLFANTLLHRIIQLDSKGTGVRYLDTRVDGGKDHDGNGNANGECSGFLPLTQANYWVWKRCRDATFAAPSFLNESNHAALLRYRHYL